MRPRFFKMRMKGTFLTDLKVLRNYRHVQIRHSLRSASRNTKSSTTNVLNISTVLFI